MFNLDSRVIRPRGALRWSACACLGLAVGAAAASVTFDPAIHIPVFERPDGAATGDFDADGDEDLAVTSDNPDKVSIFVNDGDGNLSPGAVIFTGGGTGAGQIVAQDLDGDGDVDLAVVLKNINAVQVYRNQGGVFSAGSRASVGSEPVWLMAAHLNGDTAIDLATADRSGNSVTVLMNNGAGSFSAAAVPVGQEPRAVAAGDFDGDGDMDLVASNHRDRSLSLLANNGTGSFAPAGTLSVGSQLRPEGVTTSDLDGNGTIDIASATSGNGLNFASVFMNAGGSFSGPFNYNVTGVNPDTIVAADLDCDGAPELVTSNQDSNNLSVLPNLGNGTFGAAQLLAVGTRPGTVVASNLDGDRDEELIAVNRDSNNVSELINQSCASFTKGDTNCDGVINSLDIEPFIAALFDPQGYQQRWPDCDLSTADINNDGLVNAGDIEPFLGLLFG